ncbi:DUF3828 domain-containing protein [Paraburkholderia sp. MMS20-SJTR3]|uniref:DUF3828 domain-containing protein n=1 Tax=Paraburkholderia sejongensis TaxID=2886946 RepID=A0ABS8K4A0_9BURK|nr:DUF3828 domain-containing protein [Paraburkholderia sp. MMS20-SJTR3]MCC8396992.1 DUF3828 domain-containing protein [Paraburkholderia sp. MMS20-SJTR3]
MKRLNSAGFCSVLSIVAGLLFCQPSLAQTTFQPAPPEAVVKAFYGWFIERDTDDQIYPLMDKEIRRYVSGETVERLRELYLHRALPGEVDYFTKVKNYYAEDWLAHTVVEPAIMLDDTALVAVTFGSADRRKSVVVFLRQIDGMWKISKVANPCCSL